MTPCRLSTLPLVTLSTLVFTGCEADTHALDIGADTDAIVASDDASTDNATDDTAPDDGHTDDSDSDSTPSSPIEGDGEIHDTHPPDDDTDASGDSPVAPCPAGIVCVSEFPFTDSANTSDATSDRFDAYSCAPSTRESGPEFIYRLDLPSDSFVAINLPYVGPGTDVDVHLLRADDAAACITRADVRTGAFVSAGVYWVTVDTWTNAAGDEKDGPFTLSVGVTAVDDLVTAGLSEDAAAQGLHAFGVAWQRGDTSKFLYGIIDFTLPSDEKRLFWLNLSDGSIQHRLHVAHGEGSSDPADSRFASSFSNNDGSHQSSLGMMRTAETYTGTFGGSLKLDGLEVGYNHSVRARAIVVHPWFGSTESYVRGAGQVAPTWGCPGIDPDLAADVIGEIKGGSLMFSWYPDGDWSTHSAYLR